MRKILIIILIVILLGLGYLMMFNGIEIFGGNLLSIFQIKDRSQELDVKLQKVSTLTSVDQPKAMSELNDNAKQLAIAKEEYNDKILYSSTDDIQKAAQGVQYEMEHLWVKIGNHATKNAINLRFEVKHSSTGGNNQYDLYFTVTGKYVSISEFVASIENDSSLNFKIESFKIIPYQNSTENLQATFVVRDIGIRIDKITTSVNTSQDDTSNTSQTNNTTNTVGNNS